MKAFGFILVAAGILLFATLMLVILPSVQLSGVVPEKALKPYSKDALAGRNIYITSGCVYCHSQQPRDPSYGSDQKRNWGRASTPGDYAYDHPHLLGTMRTGPDLFNIGKRQPSLDWHLVHLFQPRSVLPNSVMPSYPYFFEIKEAAAPGDRVVMIPPPHGPTNGVVVAKPEALALVAYLQSLDHSYPAEQRPFKERRDEKR
jgi:cytochrome c oxidase cbb3-type subunit 2